MVSVADGKTKIVSSTGPDVEFDLTVFCFGGPFEWFSIKQFSHSSWILREGDDPSSFIAAAQSLPISLTGDKDKSAPIRMLEWLLPKDSSFTLFSDTSDCFWAIVLEYRLIVSLRVSQVYFEAECHGEPLSAYIKIDYGPMHG